MGSGLTRYHYFSLQRHARNKHSSLFLTIVKAIEDYTAFGPIVKVTKHFQVH